MAAAEQCPIGWKPLADGWQIVPACGDRQLRHSTTGLPDDPFDDVGRRLRPAFAQDQRGLSGMAK